MKRRTLVAPCFPTCVPLFDQCHRIYCVGGYYSGIYRGICRGWWSVVSDRTLLDRRANVLPEGASPCVYLGAFIQDRLSNIILYSRRA